MLLQSLPSILIFLNLGTLIPVFIDAYDENKTPEENDENVEHIKKFAFGGFWIQIAIIAIAVISLLPIIS